MRSLSLHEALAIVRSFTEPKAQSAKACTFLFPNYPDSVFSAATAPSMLASTRKKKKLRNLVDMSPILSPNVRRQLHQIHFRRLVAPSFHP